jgi:5-hydroxyisourate hydrolase-like protein (transthyretin family)
MIERPMAAQQHAEHFTLSSHVLDLTTGKPAKGDFVQQSEFSVVFSQRPESTAAWGVLAATDLQVVLRHHADGASSPGAEVYQANTDSDGRVRTFPQTLKPGTTTTRSPLANERSLLLLSLLLLNSSHRIATVVVRSRKW